MMRFLDPPRRLALSLALLTVGVLMLAEVVGVLPDERTAAVLDARQKLCESLGIQFAEALASDQNELVQSTLAALVQRNPDLLSGALRTGEGVTTAQAGDHARYWRPVLGDRSTGTNAQVPLFVGDARWGSLELAFAPLYATTIAGVPLTPALKLSVFVAVFGFVSYALFLRRALRVIDPSRVVPPRVKTALDALAEGVVFIDHGGRVVMVNDAFMRSSVLPAERVLGRRLEDLDWSMADSEESAAEFPWVETLGDGKPRTAVALSLGTLDGERLSYSINCSPIADDGGRVQGVLVTLDDVTTLEQKNQRLNDALTMLRQAQDEIRRHNQELERLAQRDGLTGCFNRRTLFEKLERRMRDSRAASEPLACIMTDIDHFKSVNDTYGHMVGDKVIQFVANVLKQELRGVDLVGRYGGEEFCVVLPGSDASASRDVAERLRARIEREAAATLNLSDGRVLTSSFGVALMDERTRTPAELLDRADQALYVSKEAGRNRVTVWREREHDVARAIA